MLHYRVPIPIILLEIISKSLTTILSALDEEEVELKKIVSIHPSSLPKPPLCLVTLP